jgi:hypothetical protein
MIARRPLLILTLTLLLALFAPYVPAPVAAQSAPSPRDR